MMMMMSGVRASRRALIAVAVVFLLFFLFIGAVVKDLNEKLSVMTASNQEYQRMTDKLSARIKATAQEKDRLERSSERIRDETRKTVEKVENSLKSAKRELEKEKKDYYALQNEFKKMSRAYQATIDTLRSQETELRTHLAELSAERTRCRGEYDALLKMQQNSLDTIQFLQNENDRLNRQQQQQQQQQQQKSPSSSSSGSHFIKNPAAASHFRSSSTSKSQINIEEPKIKSSTSSSTQGVLHLPVAAEPPVANPQEIVYNLQKEDVMEAPSFNHHQNVMYPQHPYLMQQQQQQQQHQQEQQQHYVLQQPPQHFRHREQPVVLPQPQLYQRGRAVRRRFSGENLDRAIDNVQQDHPGLPEESMNRGNDGDYNEKEDDDAVDGQILESNDEYKDNGQHIQEKDEIIFHQDINGNGAPIRHHNFQQNQQQQLRYFHLPQNVNYRGHEV